MMLIAGCEGKEPPPFIPSFPQKQTFTEEDATSSLDSFNQYFYSTKHKLYYATTERKNIGAIWTQAIFWDIIMDAYKRTEDPLWRTMIDDLYAGAYKQYDAFNWENKVVWFIYDDMMWWIISLARAYELTGNKTYLRTSIDGYNRVWRDAYDPVGGGMFWSFNHDVKNACINYPTVIASMVLYRITNNAVYLENARKIYAWSRANLFENGTGRIADHKNGNNPAAFGENYTYNQGTCIGSAVMLFKATKDSVYLQDAKTAANFTKNVMSDSDGILPAEGDWNEQGVLKSIFAHYIMQLVIDCNQPQYLSWIYNNINTGWRNRDKKRGLTHRDYKHPCPTGRIQSYESSSIVAFMQVCPPEKKN